MLRTRKGRYTYWIELCKALHNLIKKIVFGHEEADPVWTGKKGREEIASQSHPSKIKLFKHLSNHLKSSNSRWTHLFTRKFWKAMRKWVKEGHEATHEARNFDSLLQPLGI
jgi:hypothetical protein